jgi:hypothetical protein
MKVTLANHGIRSVPEAISHGALSCYKSALPEWGERIDEEKRLWVPGHHTTHQNGGCTFDFDIEGIAVGDVTLGLHLTHPFYNSGQRSGRFCSAMFSDSDSISHIAEYIRRYWNLSDSTFLSVMGYVRDCMDVYRANIDRATEITVKFLKEDRPNATVKYIEANAPKIAQEQMRMVIPVIFPTGLTHTLNLTALAAMYYTAWSPPLRDVTQQMADAVLEKWPGLSYAFTRRKWEGDPPLGMVVGMFEEEKGRVAHRPDLQVLHCPDTLPKCVSMITEEDLHPIDTLHFSPWLMDNNVHDIITRVKVSLATMGQDQRHRTIQRGQPLFTGEMYIPPMISSLGIEYEALCIFQRWSQLREHVPASLFTILAPYGAMVTYEKRASLNALIHEGGKRTCICAQEEIYHLATLLVQKLGLSHELVKFLSPPCFLNGVCTEGVRYCGRGLKKLKEDPYPDRRA